MGLPLIKRIGFSLAFSLFIFCNLSSCLDDQTLSLKCPETTDEVFEDMCFSFHEQRSINSYDDAHNFCKTKGKRIATVKTQGQTYLIARSLFSRNWTDAMTGLHYINMPWQWTPRGETIRGQGCYENGWSTKAELLTYLQSDIMTVDKCINFCSKQHLLYAAIHLGSFCYCSNDYIWQRPASNCSIPCSGSSDQYCGGLFNSIVFSSAENGFDNWQLGRPTVYGSCLALQVDSKLNQWVDTGCALPLPFICQFSTKIYISSSDAESVSCDINACYYLYARASQSWSQADRFCRRKGGHLANIHYQYTQTTINKLLFDWNAKNVMVWVGGSNKQWFFSDESMLKFDGWIVRNEPVAPAAYSCSAVTVDAAGEYGFISTRCVNLTDTVRNRFICSTDAPPDADSTTTPSGGTSKPLTTPKAPPAPPAPPATLEPPVNTPEPTTPEFVAAEEETTPEIAIEPDYSGNVEDVNAAPDSLHFNAVHLALTEHDPSAEVQGEADQNVVVNTEDHTTLTLEETTHSDDHQTPSESLSVQEGENVAEVVVQEDTTPLMVTSADSETTEGTETKLMVKVFRKIAKSAQPRSSSGSHSNNAMASPDNHQSNLAEPESIDPDVSMCLAQCRNVTLSLSTSIQCWTNSDDLATPSIPDRLSKNTGASSISYGPAYDALVDCSLLTATTDQSAPFVEAAAVVVKRERVALSIKRVASTPPTDNASAMAIPWWAYLLIGAVVILGALFVAFMVVARKKQQNKVTVEIPNKVIFISYCRRRKRLKPVIEQIAKILEYYDYEVRYDSSTFRSNVSIENALSKEIERADLVLVCYNEDYNKSETCCFEAQLTSRKQKPFLPVRIQAGFTPIAWLAAFIADKKTIDLDCNNVDLSMRTCIVPDVKAAVDPHHFICCLYTLPSYSQ